LTAGGRETTVGGVATPDEPMRHDLALSSPELRGACAAAGVPPPLLVPVNGPVTAMPSPAGDELELLRVLGEPAVTVVAHRQDAAGAEVAATCGSVRAAGMHRPRPGDVHLLVSIDPSDVLLAAVHWSGLTERPLAVAPDFELVAADLEAASRHADELDERRMIGALRAGGAAGAAKTFGTALLNRRGAGSLTLLHRPGTGGLAGVTLGWMDAGEHGLWRMTGPNLGMGADAGNLTTRDRYAVRLRIAPVTAAALLAEMAAGWPAALDPPVIPVARPGSEAGPSGQRRPPGRP
jgi:hypothetical protein